MPKCSLKIVLEEKPIEEFYKLMLKGETPKGVAHLFRTLMVQSGADFPRLQRLSFMTTSKGRYYRRTQFKRLVQLI